MHLYLECSSQDLLSPSGEFWVSHCSEGVIAAQIVDNPKSDTLMVEAMILSGFQPYDKWTQRNLPGFLDNVLYAQYALIGYAWDILWYVLSGQHYWLSKVGASRMVVQLGHGFRLALCMCQMYPKSVGLSRLPVKRISYRLCSSCSWTRLAAT